MSEKKRVTHVTDPKAMQAAKAISDGRKAYQEEMARLEQDANAKANAAKQVFKDIVCKNWPNLVSPYGIDAMDSLNNPSVGLDDQYAEFGHFYIVEEEPEPNPFLDILSRRRRRPDIEDDDVPMPTSRNKLN